MSDPALLTPRQTHLHQQLAHTISTSDYPYPKHVGKVRDCYTLDDQCLLVATDRLSAFDRAITTIPYKGQVLTQLSRFWFEQTAHIIDNHFIDTPAPNVMTVKKCVVFPIEVVVRQYLTGSTNTSIWTQYQQGQRRFFDHTLDDGLDKNSRLMQPILTPTTKDNTHDEPLTEQMLASGTWICAEHWHTVKTAALALFSYGQQVADQAGLILVDTKYEFGLDASGNILLVDEIHTPDCSRFWEKSSYEAALSAGKEPTGFDKEQIRLWLTSRTNPYAQHPLPNVPAPLRVSLADTYIALYERITGLAFFHA